MQTFTQSEQFLNKQILPLFIFSFFLHFTKNVTIKKIIKAVVKMSVYTEHKWNHIRQQLCCFVWPRSESALFVQV